MQLTKLSLHNFGIYAGRHEVNLEPKDGKPIILFGALNGSGKTTLLEGIQFALFGRFAKFLGKGKSAYLDFLTNSINRRNLQNSASVGIEFVSRRRGKNHRFEVVRTWTVKKNGNATDTVQVFRNGQLDMELSERWEEMSETFFPSQLSDLFFFDGERIESLAQPARCSELIRTGLNTLLGLDLVTDLSKTLITLERRLRVEGIEAADREKMTRLDLKISTLLEQKTSLEHELHQVFERDSQLKIQLESLRNQLKLEGGDLYVRRDEFVHRQNELLQSVETKRQEMVQLAGSSIPMVLVDVLLQEVEAFSLNGVTGSQKEAIKTSLQMFSSNVLRELSDRGVFEKSQIELVSSIHSTLLAINDDRAALPEINISRQALIRARTDCSVQRASGLKMILELGSLQTELDQIERSLLAVPDAEKLEYLFVDIKHIEDELRSLEISKKSVEDQVQRIQREVETLRKQFDNLTDEFKKVQANEIQQSMMKARLNSGRDALKIFQERIRNKHIVQLEKLIRDCFASLLRKRTFVKSISICPETFLLTINITGEGFVPASKLSAGERQLLAVSVLWALAQASGRRLPTVIDTPLGRLDSIHRKSFVQDYFPNAGEQVILLSTDEEIIGNYHQAIKKYVSHQYLIEYDEENQSSIISKGYFSRSLESA